MVYLQRLTDQYYRELFENASEAIWIHDLDGKVIAANKAAEKLSGYSMAEQYDLNVERFLDEDGLARAKEVKQRLLSGEPVRERYTQQIMTRHGTEAFLEMATNLITIDGKPVGFQHIARDVTNERKMRANLHYYLQTILRAQEDERKRIARELHDDTVQSLLLLTRRLDSLTSGPNGKKLSNSVRKELDELNDLAVQICESLWRYTRDLRPRILDDMGLLPALEHLAGELRQQKGIDARVELSGSSFDLSDEARLIMFRIAQEALTNVGKHSEASEVSVKLEFEDNLVRLTISDNGKGFVVPQRIGDFAGSGQLGLLGMYERARFLCGKFKVQSELGHGTKVILELPRSKAVAKTVQSHSQSGTSASS